MPRPKRILAPTDFSYVSKLGLRYALEMAWESSAEVVVYHVIDCSLNWHNGNLQYARNRNFLENCHRALDKFLADNFADLVEVRQVVEFGTPHKSIVEAAAREVADMIVMSTYGRTGVDHFMLGSTAEKVVARASCPVMVIPWRGSEGQLREPRDALL
jgi:nucleotide-binding universal stress UspA family protein